MRTIGGPVRELNRDVKAVKWLPLKEAIDMLSRAHEKVFLANVGPVVVKAAKQAGRNSKQAVRERWPSQPVRNSAKRPVRRAPAVPMPAGHLISADDRKTPGSPLVKAIGGWIERIMTQPTMRRMG